MFLKDHKKHPFHAAPLGTIVLFISSFIFFH